MLSFCWFYYAISDFHYFTKISLMGFYWWLNNTWQYQYSSENNADARVTTLSSPWSVQKSDGKKSSTTQEKRRGEGGGGCTIFGCLLFFHVYRDLFLYMGICYSICGLIVSGILLYPTQIYIGIKMENIYCIKKQRSLMH